MVKRKMSQEEELDRREELKSLCRQFNVFFEYDKGDDGYCGVAKRDTVDDIEIRLTNYLKRELSDDSIVEEFTDMDPEDRQNLISFAEEKGIIGMDKEEEEGIEEEEDDEELEDDDVEEEEDEAEDEVEEEDVEEEEDEAEKEPNRLPPEYALGKSIFFDANVANLAVVRALALVLEHFAKVLESLADPNVPEVRIIKTSLTTLEKEVVEVSSEDEEEPSSPKRGIQAKAKPAGVAKKKAPSGGRPKKKPSSDGLSERFLTGDLQSIKSRLAFIEENDVPTKKDPSEMTGRALAGAIKSWSKK